MAPAGSHHASTRLGFIHAGVDRAGPSGTAAAASYSRAVVSLDTPDNALESVGGKGRSLSNMSRAGFRVPGGFLVTTAGYRAFVVAHGLQARIQALARPTVVRGRASFEQSSAAIRAVFAAHALSDAAAAEVAAAYHALPGEPPVAVRSSATAEDLPGFSFAGQHETFLNVSGADAVVAAVRDCWASLWTAQAISYRHQSGIDHSVVAMAVVVQMMIPSEVSGIMFTANPATGQRNQIVINASFGLGEAVVSGQVTPDTYMVDKSAKSVTETVLGPKEQMIVSDGVQGIRIEDVEEGAQAESSLSSPMLGELIDAALKIEGLYGGLPQDIEFGFINGQLHLLQSRPITLLPPNPDHPDIDLTWTPRSPARFLTRRQIVENMPDPLCPLFEELYLTDGLGRESKYQFNHETGQVGGPNYMTVNGYGYQRFDFNGMAAQVAESQDDQSDVAPPTDEEIEAAERAATLQAEQQAASRAAVARQEEEDMARMVADLPEDERAAFESFAAANSEEVDPLMNLPWEKRSLAHRVTMPKSSNPTYVFAHKSDFNEGQLGEWHDVTRPDLIGMKEKWAALDLSTASDETLVEAIREMSLAEGNYWTSNASHSFGVAKSTDDHLQCFLRETLPDHNYISGQFLS
jgi:hypothetical protein